MIRVDDLDRDIILKSVQILSMSKIVDLALVKASILLLFYVMSDCISKFIVKRAIFSQ